MTFFGSSSSFNLLFHISSFPSLLPAPMLFIYVFSCLSILGDCCVARPMNNITVALTPFAFTLFEYMEKKKRLENPSEQSLLLQKLPTVTPDVVELESLAEHKSHDKQGHQCLSETTPSPSKVVIGEQKDGEACSEKKEQQCHPYSPEENAVFNIQEEPRQFTTTDPIRSNTSLLQEKRKAVSQSEVDVDIISIDDAKGNQQLGSSVGSVEVESKEQKRIEFIDLSSDDEATPGVVNEGPDECIWHISGQIEKNEKYSLSLLKRWAEKTPSACKFKVWKEGQSEENAIWLSKAINLALPRK